MSGKAICASAKRMIACSVMPPFRPAMMPAMVPISADSSIEATPTRIDSREP